MNLDWLVDRADWNIVNVFENARYSHIRQAFREGRLPWGTVCESCVFLQRGEPMRDALVKEKRITKFHPEPSLACALRCPGCSRAAQAAVRKGSTFIRVELFERMLAQLHEGGCTIDFFFFCGQGEPLSHPEIHRLIDACREYFPNTAVVINTNGNYQYEKVLRGRFVDRFIVSVDGLYQASYEQYRINGNVELAQRFMYDAKRVPQNRVPFVKWKYTLFTYNDSDEELIAAQVKAEELGIDSLWFVLTFTPEHSRRYTMQNFAELPIISPLAYIYSTAQQSHEYRVLRTKTATTLEGRLDLAAAGWQGRIDECKVARDQLFLHGWIKPPEGACLSAVTISSAGIPLGVAKYGVRRPDVRAMLHLSEERANLGFRFLGKLTSNWEAGLDLELGLELADGTRWEFCLRYEAATLQVEGASVDSVSSALAVAG